MLDDKLVFILVGFPATGKSTYRKYIEENFGAGKLITFSTDDLIEEAALKQGKTYSEIFKDEIKIATKKNEENIKKSLTNHDTFIFDQTNLTTKKIKKIEDYFKGMNNVYFSVIHFSPPANEEEFKIYLERLNNRKGKKISMNIINNMIDYLDSILVRQKDSVYFSSFHTPVIPISRNSYLDAIEFFSDRIKKGIEEDASVI